MKKGLKSLVILISAISVLSLVSPISCNATTKDDVIAVARKVGMPENLVQSYISMGANIEVTSEQCDKAIAKLYEIYVTFSSSTPLFFEYELSKYMVFAVSTEFTSHIPIFII